MFVCVNIKKCIEGIVFKSYNPLIIMNILCYNIYYFDDICILQFCIYCTRQRHGSINRWTGHSKEVYRYRIELEMERKIRWLNYLLNDWMNDKDNRMVISYYNTVNNSWFKWFSFFLCLFLYFAWNFESIDMLIGDMLEIFNL